MTVSVTEVWPTVLREIVVVGVREAMAGSLVIDGGGWGS